MAKEPRHIDISSIPELQKLVHEVRQTNEPRGAFPFFRLGCQQSTV